MRPAEERRQWIIKTCSRWCIHTVAEAVRKQKNAVSGTRVGVQRSGQKKTEERLFAPVISIKLIMPSLG